MISLTGRLGEDKWSENLVGGAFTLLPVNRHEERHCAHHWKRGQFRTNAIVKRVRAVII